MPTGELVVRTNPKTFNLQPPPADIIGMGSYEGLDEAVKVFWIKALSRSHFFLL
jgi:hypothetical protein